MRRNSNFSNLETNYLFSNIREKLLNFKKNNPEADIIDLSIGNTTQPLPQRVVDTLKSSVHNFGDQETYSGYGPELGLPELREKIANILYPDLISSEEIFISDGAKTDIFRLLSLFGPGKTVAIQDPSYPAYIDAAYLAGAKKILKLPCTKHNHFFPEIPQNEVIDIFCLCSPNNPTGTALTREQLQTLVDYAHAHHSLLIIDATYNAFISDPALPKSIFEIPGAHSCAIEINSFSKSLGFAGLRLGWSIVPQDLMYANQLPIINDWKRFLCTTFNGASLPIQEAAIVGIELFPNIESVQHYRQNSSLLRHAFEHAHFSVYGGQHAPYLWIEMPEVLAKEDFFDFFLNQYQIAITPGEGFGSCGKDFVRVSALGTSQNVQLACQRLQQSPIYEEALSLS